MAELTMIVINQQTANVSFVDHLIIEIYYLHHFLIRFCYLRCIQAA